MKDAPPLRAAGRKTVSVTGLELSGYGGIGRRDGFRFHWETVQVRVLLAAVHSQDTVRITFHSFTKESIYDKRTV